MGKVRYKEISDSLAKLTQPDEISGRISIGLEKNIGEFYYIAVDDLLPFKNQARQHFSQEEIESLASSIKAHGIRHPLTIIACENEKGKYEVVSGERRLRAAKMIGLEKVPCILLKDKSIAEEIAIIENLHRQNLHPVELGIAFHSLLENGLFKSQVELANKLSITKSTVSEHLQLAELDKEIRQYLVVNNITARDKLRKIINAKGNKQDIQNILGINTSKKNSFSVMRVTFSVNGLQFQMRGLKKLDEKQKAQFKSELLKILNKL